MNALEKLVAIERELNELIVGRAPEVHGVILAALSRQHAILFGPHGEAKSMLLDYFVSYLEGAQVFTWTVAQETMPSDLFEVGHDFVTEASEVDGRQIQRQWAEALVEGKMLTAQFTLLRELFRCNSGTLNALLTAINERYWVDDRGQRRRMPLVSVFGDTNNVPGEDLEAFYDRFMLRYVVERLQERSQRIKMRRQSELRGRGEGFVPSVEKITWDEFAELQDLARTAIDVPCRIDELIEEIIERLYDEGIIVYGRRDARLNRLLKTNALLNERDAVVEADLVEVLPHCLWDDPDHRRIVHRTVLAVANPLGQKVQELLDEAMEIREAALNRKRPDGSEKTRVQFQQGCLEGNTKLKRLIGGSGSDPDLKGVNDLLEEARRTGEPTKGIEQALATIQRYQRDVYESAMEGV